MMSALLPQHASAVWRGLRPDSVSRSAVSVHAAREPLACVVTAVSLDTGASPTAVTASATATLRSVTRGPEPV